VTTAALRYAVLCLLGDPSGPWLAGGLAERGLDGIRCVSAHELAFSTSISHEVTSVGTRTSIRLADGSLFGPDLVGTVNRLTTLPDDHLAGAEQADRDYAAAEVHALFTSILASLPGRVLGVAGPRGLCGPWLSPAEWTLHAACAGLPVLGFRSGQPTPPPAELQLLVVPGAVRPAYPYAGQPLPPDLAAGAARLAEAVGAQTLGVDLVRADGRWVFAGATPLPDLRAGGPPVLDALAQVLR